MECQAKNSKKMFKVFDATKRKRTRKKHEAVEDWQSVASKGSNERHESATHHAYSTKGSFHELVRSPNRNLTNESHGKGVKERHSDQSVHLLQGVSGEAAHGSRSRRGHRRAPREDVSLALRAGLVSTPRSASPQQNCDGGLSPAPRDDNSFMEGLLEEAIKQNRRKHRQSRRREEHGSRDRRGSSREHRRRHRDELDKENRSRKEEKSSIDQAVLLETFVKLCSQIQANPGGITRKHSNKSLQCDGSRHRLHEHCHGRSREASKHTLTPTRIRSHDDCSGKIHVCERTAKDDGIQTRHDPYEKNRSRYVSKLNVNPDLDERTRGYPIKVNPTRCQIDLPVHDRMYHEYERKERRTDDYDRRVVGQRMSRSFDIPREVSDERAHRRTGRSDGVKNRSFDSGIYRDRMYEDRRYRYKDYYNPKDCHRDYASHQTKIYRSHNIDLDRASIISTDDDFRNREKYTERERESGFSVADEDGSIASCKSNYLRTVKQEITEQREAMDKMMKLWKELMRAFKGPSQSREPTKSVVEETATVRESAAAQLRLWRECMRRYETVARDVGDTDARLMEEINKQRSEMAEMTSMFQECLQRYKAMSQDFNALKQRLQSESPVRLPAAPCLVPCPTPCTDGDGTASAVYRLPPAYPPHMGGMPSHMGVGVGYPLRPQLSAPPAPACCWPEVGHSPPRHYSPEPRPYRDRHRDRDRGESKCKEKSKASGSRSEHRRRKR